MPLHTYHALFYWIIFTILSQIRALHPNFVFQNVEFFSTFISKSVIISDELTKLHIHKGKHPLNYDEMLVRNI